MSLTLGKGIFCINVLFIVSSNMRIKQTLAIFGFNTYSFHNSQFIIVSLVDTNTSIKLTFGSKVFRKRSKINAPDENEVPEEKKKTLTKENLLSNNNYSHDTNYVEKPVFAVSKKWSSLYKSEDWWAVWIGLIIFALSLPSYFGIYTLGWVRAAKSWLNITQALSTKATFFSPWIGLAASLVFLAMLLVPVTRFNGIVKRLVQGFCCDILYLLDGMDIIQLLSDCKGYWKP